MKSIIATDEDKEQLLEMIAYAFGPHHWTLSAQIEANKEGKFIVIFIKSILILKVVLAV